MFFVKQKELNNIPEVDYAAARKKLKDGDLVFFLGHKLGDIFISAQALTERRVVPFTHVGIVRKDYGRTKLIEAVHPISREIMLSHALRWYRKHTVVFCRIETGLKGARDKAKRLAVIKSAINLCGEHYESIPAMSIAFITHSFKRVLAKNRIFCSEYAKTVWQKNGLDLAPSEVAPSPAALYEDSRIVPFGKLYV